MNRRMKQPNRYRWFSLSFVWMLIMCIVMYFNDMAFSTSEIVFLLIFGLIPLVGISLQMWHLDRKALIDTINALQGRYPNIEP